MRSVRALVHAAHIFLSVTQSQLCRARPLQFWPSSKHRCREAAMRCVLHCAGRQTWEDEIEMLSERWQHVHGERGYQRAWVVMTSVGLFQHNV